MFEGRKILITGGTGSLGHALVRRLFDKSIEKVIVYSRDEYKQSLMEGDFPDGRLRFFIGDVRDRSRLVRALQGVDTVIHAAALKRVPSLEYNPTEAIKTNVLGTMNVVEACFTAGVSTAVLISTDKAVNPINLYGATKLCAEKTFLGANAFARTRFSVVRYGNVIGSRGSVIPLFQKLKKEGKKAFPITSIDMTRFWITMDEAVDLVFYVIENPIPKVVVPHIPSMKITDVAGAIKPDCEFEYIGKRAGEKLHETLIAADEKGTVLLTGGKLVNITDYRSDNNDLWMTKKELRKKL